MTAAFLANFLFWGGAAIGGIVFAALVDVTDGQWMGPMRIIAEQFRRFLPISFLLFLLLMWRSRDVYPWARIPMAGWWFQPRFVVTRDALAFAAVYSCAFFFCRASRAATANRDAPSATCAAIVLLMVYAIGYSIIATDLIMSLEPRWSSTLFPAYVFTGNVYAGTAAVAAFSAWTTDASTSPVQVSRMRDMANVLVGIALFWMYLFWSQFLVIWYGNVTAELGFMMARIGASRALGWIVLTMCCAVPSVVLVPQWGKQIAVMRVVAPIILIGLWLERWLLVVPSVQRSSALGALGVAGVFAVLFVVSVGLHRVTPR